MIHLASAVFFAAAFLAAAVALHLTIQFNLARILLALRGELGVSAPALRARPGATRPRRAAA